MSEVMIFVQYFLISCGAFGIFFLPFIAIFTWVKRKNNLFKDTMPLPIQISWVLGTVYTFSVVFVNIYLDLLNYKNPSNMCASQDYFSLVSIICFFRTYETTILLLLLVMVTSPYIFIRKADINNDE